MENSVQLICCNLRYKSIRILQFSLVQFRLEKGQVIRLVKVVLCKRIGNISIRGSIPLLLKLKLNFILFQFNLVSIHFILYQKVIQYLVSKKVILFQSKVILFQSKVIKSNQNYFNKNHLVSIKIIWFQLKIRIRNLSKANNNNKQIRNLSK